MRVNRGGGLFALSRVVVVSVLILFVLAGCDNNFSNGPLSIIRDGSAVKVAACADLSYDRITVDQRNYAEQRPWSVLWEDDEPGSLASGESIASKTDDPGLESGGDPQFSPGDDILVILFAPHETVAQFNIGEGGLSESRWLHPDGTETDTPCGR